MPETSGKTRIFRCFSGAEFNFQNSKRSKSENEFSDQTVLRLSRHGVVKASKLQVCTKGMGVNMASITPKPNGTYLIRISCGTDAAGKPVTKSRVFKPSKPKLTYQKLNRELDAFIKEFEDEIAEFVVQGRPDRMRFAEFTAKYLEVKKPQLSPVTYTFYEQVIREMLIPMFGTLRLRDIRTYHIQRFIYCFQYHTKYLLNQLIRKGWNTKRTFFLAVVFFLNVLPTDRFGRIGTVSNS